MATAKKETKTTVKTTKATASKTAAAKTAAVKAEEAKEAAVVKETAPAKKAPARRTTKAAEPKETVYVEYAGKQAAVKDMLEAAKTAFAQTHQGVAIKTIEIYVKPEEDVAYYVVNGEGSDDFKIEL